MDNYQREHLYGGKENFFLNATSLSLDFQVCVLDTDIFKDRDIDLQNISFSGVTIENSIDTNKLFLEKLESVYGNTLQNINNGFIKKVDGSAFVADELFLSRTAIDEIHEDVAYINMVKDSTYNFPGSYVSFNANLDDYIIFMFDKLDEGFLDIGFLETGGGGGLLINIANISFYSGKKIFIMKALKNFSTILCQITPLSNNTRISNSLYIKNLGSSITGLTLDEFILNDARQGTTTYRPDFPNIGEKYFDTTVGKPIWWDGTNWIDAAGTTI